VRTAVEAPEGGRAPKERAAAPIISRRQRLLMVRGKWLACAFRRRLPLLLPGGRIFFARGGRHNSDAQASRERSLTSSLPGLTRQSMRGSGLRGLAAYRSFAANQHGPPGQARW